MVVPKDALKSKVSLIPQQYHKTLEWRLDPANKDHWMLESCKESISVDDYLRTASFLWAVRTETETRTPQDAPVVADDVDEKVWSEIRQDGAYACLWGAWDYDSDSSDDEPSGEELDQVKQVDYPSGYDGMEATKAAVAVENSLKTSEFVSLDD